MKIPKHFLIVILFPVFMCCNKSSVLETKYENGKVKEHFSVIKTKEGDLRHGQYIRYDMDGRLEEESFYEKGMLEGSRKLYMNGVLQSEEIRVKDHYQGPFKAFFPDGTLQLEANYVDDVMTGPVRVYYPSGRLKEIVTFAENVENGPFSEYYENGKLKAEGNYKQQEGPVEDGVLKLYDSTGVLIRIMNCDMGKCSTTWKKDTSTLN